MDEIEMAVVTEQKTHSPVPAAGGDRATVLLLAVASACAVANLYYVQPLLSTIGAAFHLAGNSAGLFVTLTQIGYATGLFFLVPAGDLFDRRKLIIALFSIEAGVLVLAALSVSAGMFAVASVIIGLLSVSAQVIVPYAAHMAREEERGRVVGAVMSGLLLGILFARTVAGVISHAVGWRVVYLTAAGVLIILLLVMMRLLPAQPPSGSRVSYGKLLASTGRLFLFQPILRTRSLYGACAFAAFSVFWTGSTFLLSGEPYRFNDAVIGLFGLCGVAGALCASFAGRLADKGHTHGGTGALLFIALSSFALDAWGGTHLAGVISGVILLDLGVQGNQIFNQSVIYGLGAGERSRLTAAYMTPYFIGGAVGSAVSVIVYRAYGWLGVCVVGAAFVAVALARWIVESFQRRAAKRL